LPLVPSDLRRNRFAPKEVDVKRLIRLRGINGQVKSQCWESSSVLRVGRQDSLEVVLDDTSVSRFHAELRATERGWRISDLGSTNGTRLNGTRIGTGQWPLRIRDLLQFGEIAVVVEALEEDRGEDSDEPDDMRVEATARATWDEAMQGLAFDSNRCPRPGEQLHAMLRAGRHFVNLEKEEDLLQSILNDAVAVLDAQRGTIVLPDSPNSPLRMRASATGQPQPRARIKGQGDAGIRPAFSQSLAQRSFTRGESILCQKVGEDPELALARSIEQGAMASVLCILLRTPRKRLGVIHLDRGPFQKPFTMEDLHLADALAANVSAGIESAQLLRKQRDLFLQTINVLAQAVELKDRYTFNHTTRVTIYSLVLAEHLQLPQEEIEQVRTGTPLHDIGKIGIDDAILRKPGKLTPEEFEEMKLHTVKGAEIVSLVPDLHPIIPIVRSHHERWDGQGYPDGLVGDKIPRMARIVSVADAFDAMTSDRPYRKGMAPAVAFAEVEKQSGRQFDPSCAAGFLAVRERILQELRHHAMTPVVTREAKMLVKR
jgi:HD-GYP domain-containing protein (c-di-GMP phosphodiesterase class II)/pSer/pThr/pTyr-binding forkhead associated (FHA) protein